jgi:hypothetical protein
MAHAVSLTDGIVTLSLNAGDYLTLLFRFGVPDLEQGTITDSLDLLVRGSTQAVVQTNVRAIEAMLSRVRDRQTYQAGNRVRLVVVWDGQADSWEAEVIDGSLDAPESANQQWRKAVEVTLALTRKPFESAWQALSLTNRNGTNVTAPTALTITNHNDSDADNYADVDGGEIAGGLPALVKVQLTNTSGVSKGYGHWWLAAENHSTRTFAHTIEGENRVAGYGSSVSNAGSSGGAYLSQTVNGTAQTHWNMTAAQANAAGGHPFRILLAFAGAAPAAWVRPTIYDSTGTVRLAAGDEVWLGDEPDVADIGLLAIPPGTAAASYGPLRIVLEWRTLSSQTIVLDFLHLIPGYSARQAIQRGMLIATGESFVLDESEGRAYFTEAGAEHPMYVLRGQPLTLRPGRDARVSLLVSSESGSYAPAEAWGMQAWAKERRWTL